MKKLTKKEKKYCISFVAFFVIALVVGIKSVYAYYYEEDNQTTNLFATAVGNIYEYKDGGKADVAIRVYKKIGNGSNIYVGQEEIPANGGPTRVECGSSEQTDNCTKVENGNIENDNTSGCRYSYTNTSGTATIKIKSDKKAVCSFYFD